MGGWTRAGHRRVGAGVLLAGLVAAAVSVTTLATATTAGAIGECTTSWTGAAGDGLWATAGNWDNGVPDASSVACIPDVGGPGVDVEITLPGSLSLAGISNHERLVVPAGGVMALSDSAENFGVWRFAGDGMVTGDGGDPETFTNAGTVDKQGSGTATFDGSVMFSNLGTINLDGGNLNLQQPAAFPAVTVTVAAGADLTINSVDGVTQWAGSYDLTGGGTMTVTGELDATAGVNWAFGAGEAQMDNVTVDTTTAAFTVTGRFDTVGNTTIRGDGFSVAQVGVFSQPAGFGVVLLDGADVVNHGVWRFAGDGVVTGDGGDPETFTNVQTGTVHKQGSGTATFDGSAVFSNHGTIAVENGNLGLHRPGAFPAVTVTVAAGADLAINSVDGVTQWAGSYDLTGGGTMTVTGELDAQSGGVDWAFEAGEAQMDNVTVDTTAAAFSVTGRFDAVGNTTIRGDGFTVAPGAVFAQPDGFLVVLLDGADVVNNGLWRFAGAAVVTGDGGVPETFTNGQTGMVHKQGSGTATFDGSAMFSNHGTIRADAGGTLAISGDFPTDGKVVTEIAGTSASGQYGAVTVSGAATLSGEFEALTAAGFTPTAGDFYDVVQYGTHTGVFGTHTGVAPTYSHAYTTTALRLTVGAVGDAPTANPGGPYHVDEGGAPVQLDGTGSSDPDGTITTYAWSPPAGLDDPASATPTLTPPIDNVTYELELAVTDDDGLTGTATTQVVVANVAPVITEVTLPAASGEDELVGLDVSFTDQGAADTHGIDVDWGDTASAHDDAVTSPVHLEHTYAVAGEYQVQVCVTDDDGDSACQQRDIAIGDIANTAPVAEDDDATTTVGTLVEIAVLGNDSDADGDPVTISAFDATSAEGGTVTCQVGVELGSCEYTPAAGFSGIDTFGYTISDGELTDTATVTVTVQPNQAPDAVDDEFTIRPTAGPVRLNVLANDSDPDDLTPTIINVQSPTTAGGTVTCNDFGCDYTPPASFTTDTFAYTISDGELTDTATVTITFVDCPNPQPAFAGTGLVTGHRWIECAHETANGVVAASPTTIMPVDGDGGLVMTSGSVANTAGPNDGSGTTADWGTVARGGRDVSILRLDLQVPAGAVCLAFDFTFGSEEYPEFVGSYNDAFLAELDDSTWAVQGNDINAPANFAFDGAGGAVSVNSSFFDAGRVITDGGWEYDGSTVRLTARTPVTPGAHRLYLSVFDANDHILDSGVLIDSLRTTTESCSKGAGAPPVAIDDEATTPEDTPVTIPVLGNDHDPDGNPLTVTVFSQPANGTATANPNGTITFTPAPNFHGNTSFMYQVSDGTGGSDSAIVSLTVTPVNDAPVAEDDEQTVDVGSGAVTISVLGNDSDPDGDEIGITAFDATSTEGGTVSCITGIGQAGACEYTPAAGFSGADTFTYTISDGELTYTATVTVTVDTSCSAGTFVLTNGDPSTTDGALAVAVDGAGRFGSARTGEPSADFNPAGPIGRASTTFSSDVFLDAIGLLSPCGGGAVTEVLSQSATELVTRTDVGDVIIDLTQTVSPVDGSTATLTQVYRITNDGAGALDLTAVRHLDGDLDFDATLVDGGAASADGSVLYEFDQSDDPGNPVTYVGIEGSRDGTAVPDRWTIQPYEYVSDIVSAAGIPESHDAVVSGDQNADRITDDRYDVTLSQQWDGSIPAGGTTSLRTVTRFGQAVFNNTPVLTPGGPYETAEGSPVTLGVDVVDADHPDGPFTYEWTPAAGLTGSDTATPTFTPTDNGSFDFTVEVCDPGLACTSAIVTVEATNVVPSVSLPADRTVGVDQPTEVTVTFTDPGSNDTHTAVIDWRDGSAVTTVDAAVSGFSRGHTFVTTGMFTVEACVTDDDGGKHCDSMVVTVVGPPVALDDSASTAEDTAVTVDVLANDTDPEGDELTVEVFSQPANGTATANPNGTITFTPAPDFSGTTSFVYQISDGTGGSDSAIVTVTVTPVNDAPVADAGSDRTTPEGTAVTLQGSGTDVDSTELSFSWTPAAGLQPSATAAQPTFTPVDNGNTTFSLTVCDDADPPACDPTPDTMTVNATNVAPTVIAPDDQPTATGAPFSDTIAFTDPGAADTHTATVDWGDGAPLGELDPVTTGFTITHTYAVSGTYEVEVCVTDDDNGEGCDTFTLTVEGNDAPVAEDDADTTTEDTPVEIFVLANDSDADDDALSIPSVTQPDHGSVAINDKAEDTVTYTPPPNFHGTATFTYTISDGHGGTDTATVAVTVEAVNDEPLVVPGPDRSTTEGSPVSVTGSATDVDGPAPLTYHWTILEGPEVSEEPSGTFADPNSATTQFTPKENGTYLLQLQACDASELCDTDLADDTVTVTVGNVAPTVTLPADRTVFVGEATSVTVTLTDPGTNDTHSAVIDWGDGSANTTVDPAVSPFARSHGFSTAGTRTVEACVTDDDGGVDCDTMTITVVPPTRLRITDATISEPDSGTAPMTFTITANPASTEPVSVVVKTVAGSATAPSDYTALPAAGQTVTFAVGQSSRTISVPIVGDLVREPHETFTVTLSAPVNATIDDGSAIGRILNDDVCTIVGTAAADTLNGTGGDDVICGLAGNDLINGLGGNDTISGGDGNDHLHGGTDNDILRGDAGDDVLIGAAGNDVVDGGVGTDRGSWAPAPAAVTVDLTTNVATGWGTDTLATLEDAVGGAFNDTLRGNGLVNGLLGNGGNDTLLGRSGDDLLNGQVGNDVLKGEAGDDKLIGDAGGDRLEGGDGVDVLHGQDGADELFGGAGNDRSEGGDNDDNLSGGGGNDLLQGGNGNDTASGDDGNDDIQGNAGNDRVAGNNGTDRVDGGDGVDLVNGNLGNDLALGGPGNDRSPGGLTAGVHGGPGSNTVNGGTGTDYCSFGPPGETRISCELP